MRNVVSQFYNGLAIAMILVDEAGGVCHFTGINVACHVFMVPSLVSLNIR